MIVFEAEDQVGGIAKTEVRDGPGGKYRFDLGGHRFFTKVKEVDDLWHEIMREEFLKRPRMSRIYWNKKFLDYPLRGPDVIKKLGPVELTRGALLLPRAAQIKPKGRRTPSSSGSPTASASACSTCSSSSYTEKVWGVPDLGDPRRVGGPADQGPVVLQRRQGRVLRQQGATVKTLIGEFHYPRYGPGQMWEQMTDDIEALGGQVLLNTPVEKLVVEDGRVHQGDRRRQGVRVQLRDLARCRCATWSAWPIPHPKPEVVSAAKGIRYRDFLTVSLVLDGEDLFPDNWIYIHEPEVEVGRIQNFRSWSPWMVPDPTKACVGLEYFCFAGDELWEMDDDKLVELGMRELEQLGLAKRDMLEFGFATRVPKAYPMYDMDYAERIAAIRGWLDGIENLQQVGRNGLHRYNNSDHSMLTAMRAVDNLVKGTDHDIWAVNAESVYHETEEQDEQQPYIEAPETEAQKEPLHQLDPSTGEPSVQDRAGTRR